MLPEGREGGKSVGHISDWRMDGVKQREISYNSNTNGGVDKRQKKEIETENFAPDTLLAFPPASLLACWPASMLACLPSTLLSC